MTHQANLLHCTLAYAGKGWPVFPLHTIRDGKCSCSNPKCKSPGKHPKIEGGFQNATTDKTQVKKWWSKWPDANIGIRTGKESRLFVLDLDHKDNPEKDGIRSMAVLVEKSGNLPQTPKVLTGSRGEHHYFKMPDLDIGNSSSKLAAGIDIRANGGYVVAPPSLHISSNEYKWLIDPKAPLADVPKWILAALDEKVRRKGAKAKRSTGNIEEGKRNDTLISIAGSLRQRGLELEDIETELQQINTARCKPPLDKDEVVGIAESIMRYDSEPTHIPYRATINGLIWFKPTKDGTSPIPLTNFSALIKSNIITDDGVEKNQNFEIEMRLNGNTKILSVPANNFSSLNWVIEGMGPSAIVYAGYGAKDHTRVAIQMLSKNIDLHTIFRHTGWRKIGDSWMYFAGNAAIGKEGFIDGIEIKMPEGLDKYSLSEPKDNVELISAIRASLKLLDVLPDYIGFPLYCAIWRSILGGADYSIHLSGPTGTGKSVIAALVQQHFGSAMSGRALPGSWSSTANALESLAFTIKDSVFVADDFAPDGTKTDIQRLHRTAARIFRAQGNHSGRQRMRANGSLKATKPPRGLIVSTGEDIPAGQSVRARVFILELSQRDLDWQKVSDCQSDAEKGLYEKATFGFIQWLAPQYEKRKNELADKIVEIRKNAAQSDMHKRTPEMIASQYLGMQYFVEYTQEIGVINSDEAEELLDRCWDALGQAGYKQLAFQRAMEPAQRFFELISSALSSGRAHLANGDGEEPSMPYAFGWRKTTIGTGAYETEQWNPKGDQIGWIDDNNIYLDPDTSFRIAQSTGGDNGLSVTIGTLKKRLKEKNFIYTECARETLTVRRKLQGRERKVLFLKPNALMFQEPDKPDNFDELPVVDDGIPI